MKKIKDIKIEAYSESMTKWIAKFEKEFDLEANGRTPTQKMLDIIEQLHDSSELEDFIENIVISWYKIGAKRGAQVLARHLYEKDVLIDYSNIPDTIKWTNNITYYGLNGQKKRIENGNYLVKIKDKI